MSYPEVAPTISIDKNLGRIADNIDVDAQSCTDFLRRFGMDDEDIKDIEINISSESLVDYEFDHSLKATDEESEVKINAILGKYYYDLNTINLYLGSILKITDKRKVKKQAQNTLTHELIHALHGYYGMFVERGEKRNSFAIGFMGALATVGVLNNLNADPKMYPFAGVAGILLYAARNKYLLYKVIQEEIDTIQQTKMVHSSYQPSISISLKPDAVDKLATLEREKYWQRRQNQQTAAQ